MAICEFCDAEMDPKRLPRHRKVCLKNPALGYSEESIEVTSENLENLKSKPRTFHYYQKIHFTCSKCNSVMHLSRLSFFEGFVCRNCKLAETSLQLYGCEKPQKAESVKNKQRATLAKKSKEEIEKSNNKRKDTCLGKYGVEAVSQNREIRLKQINTLKQKSPEEKDLIQQKKAQTSIERYGKPYALQVPELLQKAKEGNRKTCLEKYGMPHAPKYSFLYQGARFDSTWELAVWIWAEDHKMKIQRLPTVFTYTFNDKEHCYYPDFKINGKLVEIKGSHFFNEKGEMQNPYDHSLDAIFEAKHQCGLQNGVEYWSWDEMKPILDYINNTYTADYLDLFRIDLPFPYPKLRSGDFNLIRHFHKSIYEASKKGKLSPLQAWQDKELVRKSALNRLKYVHSCKPEDVLQGFSVAHIASKISVFKPNLAEDLVKRYLQSYNQIFDPFSGFSGRLLGVTNCKKQYIGQDIHPKHVAESNEIIQYKKLQDLATVIVQDILTDEPKEFECLLTCPPYGGKEHWNENNDEIEKSCDEWIDICLEKYKCKRYLFVVDTTEKYKDNVIETFTNRSHFGKNHEYVILIDQCS